MSKQEIYVMCEELEQKLSHINAKVANASDLVQKISILAIQYTGLLAEVQGDVEDIYLSLCDEAEGDDPIEIEHSSQTDEEDRA